MAEDFSKPEDWDPADGDGSDPPSRPALHSSHVVMVGVSAEVAIAIAVASFAMGAALTGALCYFLQFRKNAAKRVSNIYFLAHMYVEKPQKNAHYKNKACCASYCTELRQTCTK